MKRESRNGCCATGAQRRRTCRLAPQQRRRRRRRRSHHCSPSERREQRRCCCCCLRHGGDGEIVLLLCSLLPCSLSLRTFQGKEGKVKETKKGAEKKKKGKKNSMLSSLRGHTDRTLQNSSLLKRKKTLRFRPLSTASPRYDAGLGPRRPRQGKLKRALERRGQGRASGRLRSRRRRWRHRSFMPPPLLNFFRREPPLLPPSPFFLLLLLPVFLKTGPRRFGRACWADQRHALRLRYRRGEQGVHEEGERRKHGEADAPPSSLFFFFGHGASFSNLTASLLSTRNQRPGAHVQDGADRVPQRPLHVDGGEARGE